MTIVQLSFSVRINSSIFSVAIGSMPEHGSSQQYLGIHGQGARDAESLLLTAGKFIGGPIQPVLHLIPKCGPPQAPFHGIAQGGALQIPVDS
jgi:hypothetical protein